MRSIDLSHLATKHDLDRLENRLDKRTSGLEASLEKRFANLEADNRVLKWMMGVILAGIISLVIKNFFA